MSDADTRTGRCPHCGTELVQGTIDFADTPDVTEGMDLQRAELQPGQMAQVLVCPNRECPAREESPGGER